MVRASCLENEDLATEARFRRYFVPLLRHWQTTRPMRILCLGCGGAADVATLQASGFPETYGIEIGWRAGWWRAHRRNPYCVFLADGRALPFDHHSFDTIIALGVIEHVGAIGASDRLHEDYEQSRIEFLREILRVLRPDGRIILACPNGRFPIDFQHNQSRSQFLKRFAARTGLAFHSVWDPFLPSYQDVRRLLREVSVEHRIAPLPVADYLGLSFQNSRYLRPLSGLFRSYLRLIDATPPWVRTSALNPYLIVEVGQGSQRPSAGRRWNFMRDRKPGIAEETRDAYDARRASSSAFLSNDNRVSI